MNTSEPEIFELLEDLDLESPVLVLALDGWVEAAGVTRSAIQQIRKVSEMKLVARFNTDRLQDHRARRPILNLNIGVVENLEWPSIELLHIE